MKKLLIAAAAVSMFSAPAFAHNGGGEGGNEGNNDNVTANVQSLCSLTNQDQVVAFGNVADTNTGAATAVARQDQVTIKCNQKFDLTAKSDHGLLRNDNRSPNQSTLADATYNNFASGINYTLTSDIVGSATLASAGSTGFGAAGGSADLKTNGNPTWGNVNLTYSTVAGGLPLLVGTYTDKVTLTVTGRGL